MFDWFTGKVAYLSTWIGFKIAARRQDVSTGALSVIGLARKRRLFFYSGAFAIASTDNIRAALGADLDGPVIEDIARGCLRNFFRACVEIAAAIKSTDQEMRARIPVVGRENIDAALAKGKGVLILSAHLGNFFLIRSRLAIDGIPTFVLVNQPRDGALPNLWTSIGCKSGKKRFTRDRGAWRSRS